MRPVDAALAGTDSLVLVDEAHLATHLQRLIPALEECAPAAQAILGESRSRPRVVALTATGDAGEKTRFDLGPDDLEHPVVKQRLDAAMDGGTPPAVDLSPRCVSKMLGTPGDDPGRAPEVLPALLLEWTKTTTPPEGEAPVEPYFSGIARPDHSVSLLWRAHVPGDGESLWPRASDREAVQVPIGEVREALGADEELCRLRPDRVTVEEVSINDLRPGDTCILPCDWGLLDEFGWNPPSTAPVLDVSLLDRGLPLDASALRRLCGVELASLVNVALGISHDDEGVDDDERMGAIEEILDRLSEGRCRAGEKPLLIGRVRSLN